MQHKKNPPLPDTEGLNEFAKAFYYEASTRGDWTTLEVETQLSKKGTIGNITFQIDGLPKIPAPETIEWANKALILTFGEIVDKPKGVALSLTNDGHVQYKFLQKD